MNSTYFLRKSLVFIVMLTLMGFSKHGEDLPSQTGKSATKEKTTIALQIKNFLAINSFVKGDNVLCNEDVIMIKAKVPRSEQINPATGLANIHSKSLIQPRSVKLTFAELDKVALRIRLKKMTAEGKNGCAKGVRQSLNKLFRESPDLGDIDPGGKKSINAKAYNETILKLWQTSDYQYTEVSEKKKFKNYDIRVLRPSVNCKSPNPMLNEHGHIEIFFEKKWYSDHVQPGSILDYEPTCFSSKSLYRLTPK